MSKIDLREVINDSVSSLLQQQRGYLFRMPTKGQGIVFIFSGGIDSTIALGRMLRENDCAIYPLYIKRGARAQESEINAVKFYAQYFQSKHSNLKELQIIEANVPPEEIKRYISSDRLKTLGHPMRNAVLQAIGVQHAVAMSERDSIQVTTVMTASSPDDHFSHNSLGAARVLTLMACIDSDDWGWQVTSPLIEPTIWGGVNKADAILYAKENGIPLDKTFTCTQQSNVQCGICPECRCRMEAFEAAGVTDPVGYDREGAR